MPVVDSSVLLALLLREPDSDIAAAALANSPNELHAPDVLHLEIANALVNAVRQRRIAAVKASPLLQQSFAAPITLSPTVPLVQRAWEISIAHARRPYDGVFVALAERRGDVVLTLDRALVAGLSGTPLARFVLLVTR